MSVTVAGTRLDLPSELARELAQADGEQWLMLDPDRRDRYRDLADTALGWEWWSHRPVPPYQAPTPTEGLTVAQVEAAVRKIVGVGPLEKWLRKQLRNELARSAAAA